MEYLFIGFGGIFGALARYAISKWVGQRWSGDFPVATFGINLTGSFILGYLFVYFSTHESLTYLNSLSTTGFLGTYTTYSTFTFEIIGLLEEGEMGTAIKYFFLSITLGLLMAYLGMLLAAYI